MTADQLPENLDDWPSDDRALLGVDRSASLDEIKRAYAARIKRFKPERFPQHFRRLRDAYEHLKQMQRWSASADEDVEVEDFSSTSNEDASAGRHEEAAPIQVEEARPRDDRWERACAGEHVEVYAEYREQTERQPKDDEAYTRLFWLLLAFPELEPGVDPATWPCRGIIAGAAPYPLVALLGDDMLNRSETALHPAVAQTIASSAPLPIRRRLAVQRWQALVVGDEDPGAIIRGDLLALAPEDDFVDSGVALAAAEALLPDGGTHSTVLKELVRTAMDQPVQSSTWLLDRVDRLSVLAEEVGSRWQSTLPRFALQAAALVNAESFEAAGFVLWEYAGRLAARPETMLDRLTVLFNEFPTVFYLLERGYGWIGPRNGRSLERMIDDDFWSGPPSREFERNGSKREWIFEFCIRYWISPAQLRAAAAAKRSLVGRRSVNLALACEDPVLALAWRIYALAWTDYEPTSAGEPGTEESGDGTPIG